MNQKQYRILIVEDDKAIRTLIETALEDAQLSERCRQDIAFSLDLSVHRMASAYALLPRGAWSGILDSIFYESFYGIGAAVLNGTYHKPPRRIHFRTKPEENEETV